jgi:hypothetical protein
MTDKKRNYNKRWLAAERTLKKLETKPVTFPNEYTDVSDEDEPLLPHDSCEIPSYVVRQISDFSSMDTDDNQLNAAETSYDSDTSNVSLKAGHTHKDSTVHSYILYSSSDESGFDSHDTGPTFKDKLASLIVESEMNHSTGDKLLNLLKDNGHPELPVTTRTLLGGKKSVNIEVISGMEYVFIGLKCQLVAILERFPEIKKAKQPILLAFNVDGISLFKSSSKSMWPILCRILDKSNSIVFPTALCYGHSKPKTLDFLIDTIAELRSLMADGLQYEGNKYEILVHSIVCDAPARAMIKGVKQYSGYYGCDKCEQRGQWNGRLTFPELGADLRTDMSFRHRDNDEHHRNDSPFLDLPIDMVHDFPIDYMHQVCLGVMKKLIISWMRGSLDVRLSSNQIVRISNRLADIKEFIPLRTFARKPRSLLEIDRWKATELRQFLLYTGMIVLKGIINEEIYEHFLLLSTSMRILVSKAFFEEHKYVAGEMLLLFVDKCRFIYGPEFMVYNIHSLLHITSDAIRYDGLDNCSAFVFENYLHKIKRLIRSPTNTIIQIVNRLIEIQCYGDNCHKGKGSDVKGSFMINHECYCEVVDSTTKDGLLLCRVFDKVQSLFTLPINSKMIGVAIGSLRGSHMEYLSVDLLSVKALCICSSDGKFYFSSILHDIFK